MEVQSRDSSERESESRHESVDTSRTSPGLRPGSHPVHRTQVPECEGIGRESPEPQGPEEVPSADDGDVVGSERPST